MDFRQTFVTGASWDTDDLIAFLGQKVKVQGHTIVAEAHSTRRYRRVQLFLVVFLFVLAVSFKSIFQFILPKRPSTRARTVVPLTMPLQYQQIWTVCEQRVGQCPRRLRSSTDRSSPGSPPIPTSTTKSLTRPYLARWDHSASWRSSCWRCSSSTTGNAS